MPTNFKFAPMTRKLIGLFSLIIVMALTSCLKDMDMKTARAGNKFLIDLPKSMAESTNLKKDADMQFSGDKSFPVHFYAIADEKAALKTMGVNFTSEEIYYLETEEISETGQNARITIPKEEPIQFLKCLRGEVIMNKDGKEQLYKVCVSEGGARFYRLVIYGETEFMKENSKAVNNILETFREWTEFQAESIEG
jgi:hypothetical protein